jgi:soluble lytic murein transglycosylase-like protein
MNRCIHLAFLVAVFLASVGPLPAWAEAPPDALLCRRAIEAAERAHGIPPHLLAAIARVESGRRDTASGTLNPWPWTINMDGQGSFYDNKMQATATAAAMRPHVTKSIDVGCMQISLTHHPKAFATLEQAFDPTQNVEYGARFLLELFQKANSWPKAVALYHSATADLGNDYQQKVYAALPAERKVADVEPATGSLGAWSWASTVNRSLLMAPLRQVGGKIIPLTPGPGGIVPPGRGLASYRATPVRLVSRVP